MRRRGFGFGRRLINSITPSALSNAHGLMEQANFAEAALTFEQLARTAEMRMGPRAPFLFIQAGLARMALKQNQTGLAHLQHGLNLFISTQRYQQLHRAGNRIIQELKTSGFEKEAQEIAALIAKHIPAIAESPTQHSPNPTESMLPNNCPACGGPLRSDEVDWIDTLNAECPFCGNPVRIET